MTVFHVFAGDAVNYAVGQKLGGWALEKNIVKREYIDKTGARDVPACMPQVHAESHTRTHIHTRFDAHGCTYHTCRSTAPRGLPAQCGSDALATCIADAGTASSAARCSVLNAAWMLSVSHTCAC